MHDKKVFFYLSIFTLVYGNGSNIHEGSFLHESKKNKYNKYKLYEKQEKNIKILISKNNKIKLLTEGKDQG